MTTLEGGIFDIDDSDLKRRLEADGRSRSSEVEPPPSTSQTRLLGWHHLFAHIFSFSCPLFNYYVEATALW